LSTTSTGRSCLRWDSLSLHAANLQDANRFPDASLNDASSYCRNPDRKSDGPWCYWGDDESSWEYCSIPSCTGRLSIPSIQRIVSCIYIDSNNVTYYNTGTVQRACINSTKKEEKERLHIRLVQPRNRRVNARFNLVSISEDRRFSCVHCNIEFNSVN